MAIISNILVGRPQTTQSRPSHTPGVRQGNAPGGYDNQPGHLADGKATARRSTGINAEAKNPIDPRSPGLSPA